MLVGALSAGTACTASPSASTGSPTPSAPIDAPSGPQLDLADLGAATIPARPFPDWLVADATGVWVANVDSGLVRLDPVDGTVTAGVEMGDIPLAMDVAQGALWAASREPEPRIVRVPLADPAAAAYFPLPLSPREESSITSDGAIVWLFVQSPLTLVGLDATTGAVVRTLEVQPGLQGLRYAEGALWATAPATSELVRLDPATGAETLRIPVGPRPAFLAFGAGSLWVMNQGDGSVSRVDPVAGSVAATIPASTGPITGGDIVADATSVWVRSTHELAVLIDPADDSVSARIGPGVGSGSIAVAGEAVWASAHDEFAVYRIPLASVTNR